MGTYRFKLSDIVEFLHFSCLNDMVDYCDKGMGSGSSSRRHESESSGSDSFYGTKDYPEASRLVRNGWPEGVRQMSKAMSIASEGMDRMEGKHATMDVVGPIPITGAYCVGDPECMMLPAEPDEKPVINLIVDANATANVNAGQMKRRGAAILALAQRIEETGRSVAIFANCSNIMGWDHKTERSKVHSYMVCLKKADADFNIHTLSYALVNISYFRRHGFRILEKCKHTSGYGGSIALTSIEGVENAIGNIDLYFQCANTIDYRKLFKTQDTANEYALKVAREAGIIG